jgi:hypothetical protein
MYALGKDISNGTHKINAVHDLLEMYRNISVPVNINYTGDNEFITHTLDGDAYISVTELLYIPLYLGYGCDDTDGYDLDECLNIKTYVPSKSIRRIML